MQLGLGLSLVKDDSLRPWPSLERPRRLTLREGITVLPIWGKKKKKKKHEKQQHGHKMTKNRENNENHAKYILRARWPFT